MRDRVHIQVCRCPENRYRSDVRARMTCVSARVPPRAHLKSSLLHARTSKVKCTASSQRPHEKRRYYH